MYVSRCDDDDEDGYIADTSYADPAAAAAGPTGRVWASRSTQQG